MCSTPGSTSARLDEVIAAYLEQRDRGEKPDKQALVATHPGLAKELLQFFSLEHDFAGQQSDGCNTPEANSASNEIALTAIHESGGLGKYAGSDKHVVETADHTPGRSRGLHIRCPHCSNAVELLADTPFEEITCRVCGSTFNLAVREEHTAVATALQQVGRFELVSRLGLGGFGTVWKARDTELDRVVAVKIPRKGQLSANELEQFFREARAAAQLRHPNIVPVFEVGREQDTIFIVCAFIRGVSLDAWLTGNKLDQVEASKLLRTVASALHHAHQHGVIHRDLKPSNIMLDDHNVPHLMDFGLAKRDVHEITMTVDGQILGTPAYMSPEQARGQAHWTDRRTDIYSLGVMLFEMLTGEKPFRGNAQMQVHQRLTEDAPDPRTLNRHISRDLATICLKCLERDPNSRFANCQLIVDELDRYLAGQPILSRPISRVERLIRWSKRRPAKATALLLAGILAIGGPATAIRIEQQRERLAQLVGEKDDLIQEISSEKEVSNKHSAALEQELALLKGQANPWEIWPLERNSGPKKQLLNEVYRSHYETLAARLESAQDSLLDRAYGHLALAMLAEQVDQLTQAKEQYKQALKLFEQNSLATEERVQILQAKAVILLGLSRLDASSNKEVAGKSLQAASEIYKSLSQRSMNDVTVMADYLDAEMRRAVVSQGATAREHLTTSVKLIQAIVQRWPKEPREFFSVINQIAEGLPTAKTESETREVEIPTPNIPE